MLKIEIQGMEQFDEVENRFLNVEPIVIELEHSLVSLSKWESRWEIPFLDGKDRTEEQAMDYIKCMTLTSDVPDDAYNRITDQQLAEIDDYISRKMTATWFSNQKKNSGREVITSEIIYYWMISMDIPFETQHWHLARLITLIEVCSQKNQQPKKMSKSESLARQKALNAQRRAQYNTNG